MDPNTAVSVVMNSLSIPKLRLCISIVCKVHTFYEGHYDEISKCFLKLHSSVNKSLEISSYFCDPLRIYELNCTYGPIGPTSANVQA